MLIDADLRAPSVHRVLGLDRSPGLTEVLLDGAEPAVDRSEEGSLQVITAGRPVEDAVGLLAGPDFEVLLDKLAATSFVMVDTPPAGLFADAGAVARSCDGYLLVVRAGAGRRGDLEETIGRLDQVGALPARRRAEPQPPPGQPLHLRPAPQPVQPAAPAACAALVAADATSTSAGPCASSSSPTSGRPTSWAAPRCTPRRSARRLAAAGHEVGAVTLGYDGRSGRRRRSRPGPTRRTRCATQPGWKRLLAHGADLYRPRRGPDASAPAADRLPARRGAHQHRAGVLDRGPDGARPARRVGHLHTMHDYWLLCARTNLRHRHHETCGPPCAAIRRIRRRLLERHPPDEITSLSQAVFDEHDARGVHLQGLPAVGDQAAGRAAQRASRRSGPDRPIVFGFIGQVNPNKGIATLVEAFTQGPRSRGRRCGSRGAGASRTSSTGRERESIIYDGFVSEVQKEQLLRRHRLHGDAVGVARAVGHRDQRGQGPGPARARRPGRRHPRVRARRLAAAALPVGRRRRPGRVHAGCGRGPKRYAPVPSDLDHDWDDHLGRASPAPTSRSRR